MQKWCKNPSKWISLVKMDDPSLDIPSNYFDILWWCFLPLIFVFSWDSPIKSRQILSFVPTDLPHDMHRVEKFLSFKRMFFGSFLLMLWRNFPELNLMSCKSQVFHLKTRCFFVERSECNGERRVAPLCVAWARDQNLKVQQAKSHTRSLANSCTGMGCTNLDTVRV